MSKPEINLDELASYEGPDKRPSRSSQRKKKEPVIYNIERPSWHIIRPEGKQLDIFLTSDEALQDVIISLIRRYILDPLDIRHTDDEIFLEFARKAGATANDGTFDYRLRALQNAKADTRVELDDVWHIAGQELYHAFISRESIDSEVSALVQDLRYRASKESLRDNNRYQFCRVYDFRLGRFRQQEIKTREDAVKWSLSDYYAARLITELCEQIEIYADKEAENPTYRTQPVVEITFEDLDEIKKTNLSIDPPIYGIPRAEMFTTYPPRRKAPAVRPRILMARYFHADDMPIQWIQFHHAVATIQRGFLGSLLEEIANHAKGRTESDSLVVEQLYSIADLLFDDQIEFNKDGTPRKTHNLDLIAIYEKCQDFLEKNSKTKVISVSEVTNFAYDLVDNPRYGLYVIQEKRVLGSRMRTPREMLDNTYLPKAGPNASFGALHRTQQLTYCADFFNELIGHTFNRDAASPRLTTQLEILVAFIKENMPIEDVTRKRRLAPLSIDAPEIRNQILSLLRSHESEETFNIKAIERMVRSLMSGENGLERAENILPDPNAPKAPRAELLRKTRRQSIRDVTTATVLPPKAILTQYQDDIDRILNPERRGEERLKKFQIATLAFELMEQLTIHAKNGEAGYKNLDKQLQMWTNQLRDLSEVPDYPWHAFGRRLLRWVNVSSRGLSNIRPIIIIESINDLLSANSRRAELTPEVLARFVEERIEDENDGLEPWEEIRALKRVFRGGQETGVGTLQAGRNIIDLSWKGIAGTAYYTVKALNFPVRLWDKIFELTPVTLPAIHRTGKHTIVASEAIWLGKAATEVTNFEPLRRIDNYYQGFVAGMAQTAENPWLRNPVNPWLRDIFVEGIPSNLRKLGIGNPQMMETYQNLANRVDFSTIMHWVASSPGALYTFGAFTVALGWRAGMALLSSLPSYDLPWKERDFAHYFGKFGTRAMAMLLAVQTMGLSTAFRNIYGAFDGKNSLMDKLNRYLNDVAWFSSRYKEK